MGLCSEENRRLPDGEAVADGDVRISDSGRTNSSRESNGQRERAAPLLPCGSHGTQRHENMKYERTSLLSPESPSVLARHIQAVT
jgi:hypothetical protein